MISYERFRRKKRDLHEWYRRLKKILLIPFIKPLKSKENSPLHIVSLTSYGKRLANTAPYSIITLLNQKTKPDKIVLWVGYQDEGNIPKILKILTKKGLEIKFCEDVR
ncbi:MAG: hypothetical protein LBH98_07800 [Chitinispirillales bacterium]|jgi:hypothetical protein|nr:hypothetical protein [Chitinispirillales bacterium]